MVHSQLPLLSLLCLLGALLLLAPQLALGIPTNFTKVPIGDTRFQLALGFAVSQYNHGKNKNANYFKLKRLGVYQKMTKGLEYNLSVGLMKTACKKTCKKLTFQQIQRCKQFPGKPQRIVCFFKVAPSPLSGEMMLTIVSCT